MRCADGKYYYGSTGDLRRRIGEHHNGKVRSTAWRRPCTIIYLERHATAAEARARERQFKGGRMRKKTLALLINRFWGKPVVAPAQPRVKG